MVLWIDIQNTGIHQDYVGKQYQLYISKSIEDFVMRKFIILFKVFELSF